MNITVNKNGITKVAVGGPELDIYSAIELKESLQLLFDKGLKDIELDLSKATSMSTSAIQVLISGSNSFNKLTIEKGSLQPSIIEDLKSMGINL